MSLRSLRAVLAFALTMLASMPVAGALPSAAQAAAIVDEVDRLLRGNSSVAKLEMAVVTRRWERTMLLAVWSESTDKALVRVLEPRREAGTATLKVGTDIWNYLPRVDRTIRVPSSMMAASWMGSHFTNDDLVQQTRLARDYEIEATFAGRRDATELYEFTLTSRPDAPVVWGRIVLEVRMADRMPIRSRYYGEDGRLRRTMDFADYRDMDGRLVPTRMRMTPEDGKDEFTEMRYHEIRFDVPIPPQTFSLAALR
jgi:hypothetical protein